MKRFILENFKSLLVIIIFSFGVSAQTTAVEVSSLSELAKVAAENGKTIKMTRRLQNVRLLYR
jgi:hypothetical protein